MHRIAMTMMVIWRQGVEVFESARMVASLLLLL